DAFLDFIGFGVAEAKSNVIFRSALSPGAIPGIETASGNDSDFPFESARGEDAVDRAAVLATLDAWLTVHAPQIDRSSFEAAGNEALVDGLAMMSPCGAREKQALLEVATVAERATLLIAVTERSLAGEGTPHGPLQ
ncbi:MAG: hypothetical protein GX458_16140, partial [Phyllobacteriaceae bacterium]|nr:hypothetical protein [Phyllobacteriaceae bacterium]